MCRPPGQLSVAESPPGQGEVLALQASLFQAQLELQAADRTKRQASRSQENLRRALERLETDLEGALQHRRDTQRHNQVRGALSVCLAVCWAAFCLAAF